MKRYQFRAEKVLRVRRLQEDLARAGVAAAHRDEQAAAASLSASQARYDTLSAPSAVLSPVSFLAAREQAGFRAAAVTIAERQRQAAAEATTQALTVWHDANRKVDGLERLDARRRDEYAVEAGRAHDAVVDEIVVARARRSA